MWDTCRGFGQQVPNLTIRSTELRNKNTEINCWGFFWAFTCQPISTMFGARIPLYVYSYLVKQLAKQNVPDDNEHWLSTEMPWDSWSLVWVERSSRAKAESICLLTSVSRTADNEKPRGLKKPPNLSTRNSKTKQSKTQKGQVYRF